MRLTSYINEKSIKIDGRRVRMTAPVRSAGQSMVDVSVYEFEKAWKKDSRMYIGRRGSGGIGKRYENFEIFVRGGSLDIGDDILIDQDRSDEIEVPEVGVSADGSVDFTNGRHRWAWLRDQGLKTIPVMMSSDSVKWALLFGYIKGK